MRCRPVLRRCDRSTPLAMIAHARSTATASSSARSRRWPTRPTRAVSIASCCGGYAVRATAQVSADRATRPCRVLFVRLVHERRALGLAVGLRSWRVPVRRSRHGPALGRGPRSRKPATPAPTELPRQPHLRGWTRSRPGAHARAACHNARAGRFHALPCATSLRVLRARGLRRRALRSMRRLRWRFRRRR